MQLEAISKPTLESARAALERKAKIYDKLRKGKTGGLNEKQYESLLVDVCSFLLSTWPYEEQFDSKPAGGEWESDSDDVDESLTVPRAPEVVRFASIAKGLTNLGRSHCGIYRRVWTRANCEAIRSAS